MDKDIEHGVVVSETQRGGKKMNIMMTLEIE